MKKALLLSALLLLLFGCAALAEMGDVTVEISNITIWQRTVA